MAVTENSPQKSFGISSSVTILRPKSPTKSICDKNFITFMETNINESFSDDLTNPREEILCAFSAPFLFRSPNGSFLPNVNMQMYWCNFCRFKCQEKQKMIEHSQTHRFKCNYCDKESYLRKDIIKHSMKAHNEYIQIKYALKSCALLDDYLSQKEMTLKEQCDDSDKITINEHNYFATYNVSKVTSTEPCQSSSVGDNSVKECEDIDNITPSLLEMPSNSLLSETMESKSLSYNLTNEGNVNSEMNTGASESVSIVVESCINSTMNLMKTDDLQSATNIDSQSQFSTPNHTNVADSVDNYFGPKIVSVESLCPNEEKSTSNISHTEVSTTDLNTPSKRKRDGQSDSESLPEDEDIDPDYDPEESKPGRRTSKRKLSERIRVSNKSKTPSTPSHKLAPGTKFWRCRYCKCRSSSIEKIVLHLKDKHSNKPLRFVAHVVGKNGEITQVPEKPVSNPTPSKATDTTYVEPQKVQPSSSESKTSVIDDNKEGKQYLCFFCDTLFSNMNEVRKHMFKVHPSRKFYCIDIALKEKNMEHHTFFCCRHKCNFVNVDPEEYVSHVEKCTPIPIVDVDSGAKPTGLQQTVIYAKKLINQKLSPSSHSKKKRHSQDKDNSSKKTDNKSSKSVPKDSKEQLYSCHSCDFSALGNTLIKSHLKSKHPDLALSALVKKDVNSLEFYFFCAKIDCDFVAQQKAELLKHSKEKHNEEITIDNQDTEVKPTVIKTEDSIKKSNVTYMPAYECLYCESSSISTSLTNMKRHVQEAHPAETIVVRDCIAYKCKRPSRIYVCDSAGCIFNDLDYRQYLIHVSAHKKSVVYECSSCPSWISPDKEGFVKHIKKEPNKKHSLAKLQVSMKSDGSILMQKEDGTVVE